MFVTTRSATLLRTTELRYLFRKLIQNAKIKILIKNHRIRNLFANTVPANLFRMTGSRNIVLTKKTSKFTQNNSYRKIIRMIGLANVFKMTESGYLF
jgi:hypothetical protein